MLTRIRNAPAGAAVALHDAGVEAARQRARGAEARGLHPRLGAVEEHAPGVPAIEIELKYHEGEPAIKEIDPRLQAGPARLFEDQGAAAVLQRARHLDPVDAARRDDRQRGPRRQCRRRSPLPRVLRQEGTRTMSRVGKYPVTVPRASRRARGPAADRQGQARRAQARPDRRGRCRDQGRRLGRGEAAARQHPGARAPCGAPRAA